MQFRCQLAEIHTVVIKGLNLSVTQNEKKWNESVSFDGGIHSLYGLTSEFNVIYINNFIFLVKCFSFLFIL